MKKNIWIIIGVIALLVIIYFVMKARRTRKESEAENGRSTAALADMTVTTGPSMTLRPDLIKPNGTIGMTGTGNEDMASGQVDDGSLTVGPTSPIIQRPSGGTMYRV